MTDKKPRPSKKTRSKAAAKKTAAKKSTVKRPATMRAGAAKKVAAKPKLLSGDNPQIPKGLGDAPVQAYLAAIPGWKQDAARRLDAIITRAVPDVRKGVKWNSPMYGVAEGEWFLSFHCFKKYIKVAFLRGAALRPTPPVESSHEHVRYLHVFEDEFDEAQFTKWVKQASKLPGERM